MTDLGKLNYFLGMEFTQTAARLLMYQQRYMKELLERFKMALCNDVRSPLEVNAKLKLDETEEGVNETIFKHVIGSLRFLCNSRPDLMFSVGLLSRFMGNPKKSHMLAAKKILRYVKGTTNYGILFPYGLREDELKFVGYADSDYGEDLVERKSTSGNIFFFNKAPVSWSSRKHNVVALSSCEAEYIAKCHAACQKGFG
ncbi:secreted RxLR effector protein 161-like [Vigna angularis]|uniref:secreted RxLR effector protein 161-like n=1 Tax=Phaseolus angularis TaxID=3914 RepID=UPI0022B465AE|nr:secreted RxLR effector protein 161-like [Vigna angularis]